MPLFSNVLIISLPLLLPLGHLNHVVLLFMNEEKTNNSVEGCTFDGINCVEKMWFIGHTFFDVLRHKKQENRLRFSFWKFFFLLVFMFTNVIIWADKYSKSIKIVEVKSTYEKLPYCDYWLYTIHIVILYTLY